MLLQSKSDDLKPLGDCIEMLDNIHAGGISPDTMEDAYLTVVPKVNPPKSKIRVDRHGSSSSF